VCFRDFVPRLGKFVPRNPGGALNRLQCVIARGWCLRMMVRRHQPDLLAPVFAKPTSEPIRFAVGLSRRGALGLVRNSTEFDCDTVHADTFEIYFCCAARLHESCVNFPDNYFVPQDQNWIILTYQSVGASCLDI
jgi:hypothetical protein